ncbi:putative Tetraspanin family protein [Heracleum sosnowskyi]|uniref:Tetraspanin family protein n=1 Tax=Heracleum sosnowskyi TaxID=360622 RepID=A0AAD8HZP4_9APIA|nr:putative Tetraspanin family protein [Heracleum sosnowskyi]
MLKLMMSCLQVLLKLFNSIVGMAGIVMVLYGLWLIKVWQSDIQGSFLDHQTSFPWFIHAFIGLGISSCAIACLGHFAAHTAYSNLLSYYISVMSLLLLLEIAMMTNEIFNFWWLKDLTNDPAGRFDNFIGFVESNLDVCRWVGVLIILAQGVSILLATAMKILNRDLEIYSNFEDDSAPPHLYTPVHQLPYFTFTNYV